MRALQKHTKTVPCGARDSPMYWLEWLLIARALRATQRGLQFICDNSRVARNSTDRPVDSFDGYVHDDVTGRWI